MLLRGVQFGVHRIDLPEGLLQGTSLLNKRAQELTEPVTEEMTAVDGTLFGHVSFNYRRNIVKFTGRSRFGMLVPHRIGATR